MTRLRDAQQVAAATNLQVVQTICDIVDQLRPDSAHRPCSSLIQFVQDRPGHDRRYAIDAGKMQRELGWMPRHDFASGIEQTIRWYLDNRDWCNRVRSGEYQNYYREQYGRQA